jgi:putative ABC transport system ATP-binding protein
MIKIEQLTKIFRTKEIETLALNDINLQIEKGEFVSIMKKLQNKLIELFVC